MSDQTAQTEQKTGASEHWTILHSFPSLGCTGVIAELRIRAGTPPCYRTFGNMLCQFKSGQGFFCWFDGPADKGLWRARLLGLGQPTDCTVSRQQAHFFVQLGEEDLVLEVACTDSQALGSDRVAVPFPEQVAVPGEFVRREEGGDCIVRLCTGDELNIPSAAFPKQDLKPGDRIYVNIAFPAPGD